MDKNGWIYIFTSKEMHGLKQGVIIAHTELKTNLESHGYIPVPLTTNLWENDTKPTIFTLVADNFSIIYIEPGDS